MRSILALSLVLVPVSVLAQTVQTVKIPRPTAEFAEPFSEIRSLRELSDGRIIVVDGKDFTVQLVNLGARTASVIGRTGSGPGEYRWPGNLYPLPGDSTLLHDVAGGRLLIIRPDGKPGDIYDPNRNYVDDERGRATRFILRAIDAAGRLYAEAQPIRVGADGKLELADSSAVVRLDRATGKRDTVAMIPQRHDANARLMGGSVITQPRMYAFPAWDHWVVAPDGRVAMITFEPYRVSYATPDRRRVEGPPIPYTRVPVDNALKEQHLAERSAPRPAMRSDGKGGSSMVMMRPPGRDPTEWPDHLPPYLGSAVVASDGAVWIPRAVAAGKPPLYDIIDGNGRLVERVELPPRHKLVGFGNGTMYLVRLDDDDLQYLQRYPLPTTARP